jgi:ubiquinone/menaquinone biosynthesis C-methylase UbiE
MKSNSKDFFGAKAKTYDKDAARVDNVSRIANLILKEIEYQKKINIMDFGSGTGLLLSKIAPYVNKITAIDISKSMNEVLRKKKHTIESDIEILEIDLSRTNVNQQFDGIISSMTLHHIKDTKKIFKKFYNMLNSSGSIAIADLDKEDGTFHKDDTGVFHFGFDRDELLKIVMSIGFRKVKIQTVGLVEKPYGKYSVFLLTAYK